MHVGDFDQALAAVKDMANLLMSHFHEMLRVGFTPEQALSLTIAFQREMIRPTVK